MTPMARQAADLTNEAPSFSAVVTYMEYVVVTHMNNIIFLNKKRSKVVNEAAATAWCGDTFMLSYALIARALSAIRDLWPQVKIEQSSCCSMDSPILNNINKNTNNQYKQLESSKHTVQDITYSCFSLLREKKTAEVIPAKQVTADALTWKEKQMNRKGKLTHVDLAEATIIHIRMHVN